MPAAPLIAKKLSASSSPAAVGMELDRRAHAYANEVDPARSCMNEYLCGGEWVRAGDGADPEPLEDAIERRMGELNTRRKIRSDAVKAMGFVLSSNAQLDEPTAVEFLKEGVKWMTERYGRENVLAAAIHMDEDTPHAQLWIAPVIHDPDTGYDRLSAKELFTPNKVDKAAKKVIEEGTLTRLQRDFYREVSSRYGYSEPFTAEQRMSNGKIYKSQAAYKADQQTKKALLERDEALREAAEARREAGRLSQEVRGLESALERLTERFMTLLRHITEVADTMAHRKHIGTWRAGLEALRDNPIARAAVEAGRPWIRERDARRAENSIKRDVREARDELAELARETQRVAQTIERERVALDDASRDEVR